jgi:hypothetical protein
MLVTNERMNEIFDGTLELLGSAFKIHLLEG